ncbi:MAG TPA: hypothetical protein VFC99_03230 [Acidimicrobiia bacterium]|nr:hypothetical protein [Acidimicrobiia bacterium]
MRKVMVTMGAAVLALTLAAPAAGAAAPARTAAAKTVSVEKYAKVLCSTYTAWQKSLDGSNAPSPDVTDLAAAKKAATDYFAGLVASTKAAIAKLKKAGIPDVDNGKRVAKSFRTYLSHAAAEISDALAKVDAADPTSADYLTTVSQVLSSLATIDTRLGDPFSKVESQDLLGAFKAEKSCKGVVTIIGG